MNKYTIYCTKAQTTKALELGAPVEKKEIQLCDNAKHFFWHDGFYYNYPTAEQMIGWLEEQGMQFNFHSNIFNEWEVLVYTENTDYVISEIADSDWKKTKKEATLVAIDASLEYLSNNKK